jgi:hypothetical protein
MIEESRIKNNLKKFAFPRLSGTEFEKNAFNKLKQEVERLNLEFEVQPFTFSSFYSRIYPKIAFSVGTSMFILMYLNIQMIIFLILIDTFFGLLVITILITRKPERIQFTKKFNSQNLLVKIKTLYNEHSKNNRVILFMSHLDSKGQRFKIKVRIRIIRLWILSSTIIFVIIILKNVIFFEFELIFYIIGVVPILLNLCAMIILLLNTTDNSSKGAIDNASGIVCNLELLNYYHDPKNRLTNYSLWFLFTGAEECGTMGIRHFYNNLVHFDPEKSIIFDIESIAKHAFLFPGGNEGDHAKNIDHLLLNNHRNLMLRHFITKRVIGTHSDGTYLGNKGFQGYGIGDVGAHEYMHTPNDTIDKIDTKVLEKLCLVLTDALKEHDVTFFK